MNSKSLTPNNTQVVNSLVKSKKWTRDHQIQYFSKEELKKLFDNLYIHPYYEALILFTYETASRISEVLMVKVSDLEKDTQTVKVPTLKQRRETPPTRTLKLSPDLMKILFEYICNAGLENEDFLFAVKKGSRPVSRCSVFRFFQKLVLETLGENSKKRAHLHTLRHSRAIHILQYGETSNIAIVKNVLGHTSIENTAVYLKYSNREVNHVLDSVNSRLGLFD